MAEIDIGLALIITGFTTPLWILLMQRTSLSNWFKKEQWKFNAANEKKINSLKLKKLERELGVASDKKTLPSVSASGIDIAQLLPLLKNLEPEQLSMLADKFLGGSDVEREGSGLENALLEFAANNPEMVQGFLSGLGKVTGGEKSTDTLYES